MQRVQRLILFLLLFALVLPACARRAYNKGNDEMDLGNTSEAIHYYLKAVRKDPGEADYWAALGEAYVRDAAYARGVEALNKAAELDPSRTRVLEQLGFAHVKQGNTTDAIDVYWRLFTLRGHSENVFKKLRPLLEADGRFNEVAEAALMISKKPKFDQELVEGLSKDYQRAGHFKEAEKLYVRLVELDASEPKKWRALGDIRLKLGNGPGAAEAFGRAYRLAPDDINSGIGSAAALRKMGRLEEATSIYERVVERAPELLEPRIALIELYLTLGRADQAVVNAREAFIRYPKNLRIRALKGASHLAKGDWDKAIYALEVAERSETESKPWMTRMLGEAYLGLGERATARRYFTRAVSRDNKDGMAYLGLCRLDLEDKREQGGIERCQQAMINNPDLRDEAVLLMSDYYERSGRFMKAVEVEEETPEEEESSSAPEEISVATAPTTVVRKSRRTKTDRNASKAKLEDLRTLKELLLSTPEEHRSAREWFDLGEVSYKLEDLELAETALTAAWKAEPKNLRYRSRMAQILLSRGKYDSALLHLKDIIRKDERDVDARFALAHAYLGRGSAGDALQVLRELRELVPDDPRVYELSAEACFDLGRQNEGEKYQRQAISKRSQ